MKQITKEKSLNKTYEELIDSDNDGIYDDWEINGYTVEKGLIVKWDESKHRKQGFIKYQSDPFSKSTTGDPYSDVDKVLNKIDGGILVEAHHPLVAACPEVGVNMEKLILSKNINISKETGETKTDEQTHTVAIATNSSHTESHTLGASLTTSSSVLDPFGVSVSINYSNDWSTTVSNDESNAQTNGETKGNSWTSTLGINNAEAAFLNGNVRYINAGTAPIYEVKPTLNFVLGIGSSAQTISTVAAKSNAVADFLLPNKTYPDKKQNPIAWNVNDDFNSHPIQLNYEQVQALEKGAKLQIQTTQTSGLYIAYNLDEKIVVTPDQAWRYYLPTIFSRTACITIAFENELTMKRRISARKAENYNSQTQPEITLKEAIELAFPGAKINSQTNQFIYKDLYEGPYHLFVDQFTRDQMVTQLEKTNNKNLFNIKLIQGMNILFAEKSNQILLNEVTKFFEGFNENNRISLKDEIQNDKKNWQEILPVLKKILQKKFKPQDFARIKNLIFLNPNVKVTKDIDAKGNDSKVIIFEVGKLSSKRITIFFKEIDNTSIIEKELLNYIQSISFVLTYDKNYLQKNDDWKSEDKILYKWIKWNITKKFSNSLFEKMKNIKYDWVGIKDNYDFIGILNMSFTLNNVQLTVKLTGFILPSSLTTISKMITNMLQKFGGEMEEKAKLIDTLRQILGHINY